jgi:Zn-dependent M16 (insulinase) family peptidase
MLRVNHLRIVVIFFALSLSAVPCWGSASDLVTAQKGQSIGDLRVVNLYADENHQVVGAKLEHHPSGAPIYFFQIETVPQLFMWIDAPAESDRGLAHSLEHLLAGKGTKGRYLHLLTEVRLSRSASATTDDYSFYSFASGTGLAPFFEQFHGWLNALYQPDFTNLEAERELYHLGASRDPETGKQDLIEKGSVYNEMQAGQGDAYYFALNRLVFGNHNPFAYNIGGVPDAMRLVKPDEIRQFYSKQYNLGPATGFIIILDPKEDAIKFLRRVSKELGQFSGKSNRRTPNINGGPKYPVSPSQSTEPQIYPYPSSTETDPGEIRFGWRPFQVDSQADVRLLQLFFRVLGGGEQSVLYQSLVDSKVRELDSGATNIESLVFLENSPHFPAEFVGVSGIPGDRINVDQITRLRNLIMEKITEISNYPDFSLALRSFNRSAMLQAKIWRRAQRIWLKTPPRFGVTYDTDWKEYLQYLDMSSSFIQSLSDEPVWGEVEKRVQSGRNVWRDLISHFHLLEVPYATASVPSPRLMDQAETARKERVRGKIKELTERSRTSDEQKGLAEFVREEAIKTREIDKIAARVAQPAFIKNPPLTPDEGLHYRRFNLDGVPVIATFFKRAPTIDLGLSFDLREIPQKFYKYLPILPQCIDSLGLRTSTQTLAYPDLLAKIRNETSGLSVAYEFNPMSRRADLSIRLSAANLQEFDSGLAIVRSMIQSNSLDRSDVGRLRDVVDKRLWEENYFNKGGDYYWFLNPAYAFRYQDDALYLALSSVFTRSHWDARLKWRLHEPVVPSEIARLDAFAQKTLEAASGLSHKAVLQKLSESDPKGLESELVDYWERNISAFPETGLVDGLKQLSSEVLEDLRNGPDITIEELREVLRLVIDRRALHIDLTANESIEAQAGSALSDFLESLPTRERWELGYPVPGAAKSPISKTIEKRYKLPGSVDFPWYLGFEDPETSTTSMFFVADYPGYTDLDRNSVLQVLSSKMVSGSGPHTPYMKIEEDGLAYGAGITSDQGRGTISYYADRSPDVPSLLELVNSLATALRKNHDPALIDYALQKSFPLPRSMATFSERGRGIASDIRDGNDPEKIRRFSLAILSLRKDPKLLTELDEVLLDSISPVLVKDEFKKQQRKKRSVFFFAGPEERLSDAEAKLNIAGLYRIFVSDFWIDF